MIDFGGSSQWEEWQGCGLAAGQDGMSFRCNEVWAGGLRCQAYRRLYCTVISSTNNIHSHQRALWSGCFWAVHQFQSKYINEDRRKYHQLTIVYLLAGDMSGEAILAAGEIVFRRLIDSSTI